MSDDIAILVGRMAWDMFPREDIERMLPQLGLVPPSKDVLDLEIQESEERSAKIRPIQAYLEAYITIAVDLITKGLLSPYKGVPEAFYEGYHAQNAMVIRASIYTVLTQMLDNGVIEYGDLVKKKGDV